MTLCAVNRPELGAVAEEPPLFGLGLIGSDGLAKSEQSRGGQRQGKYRSLHAGTAFAQNPIANWLKNATSLGVAPRGIVVGVELVPKNMVEPPASGSSRSNSFCQTIDGAIQ